MNFNDKILFCGNGAGFMAIECLVGIYRAFEEKGEVPGKVLSSSGSTLFSSLYYSDKNTGWFDGLMTSTSPSDFIKFSPISTARTLISKGNHMIENEPVYNLLKENMNGNASQRVVTSVTRNSDWSSHMKKVTPGWALAATSIPFVFKPVLIAGELWSDGGVLNNLPVPTLREAKSYERIYVFIAPPTHYIGKGHLIPDLIDLLQAVMQREVEQLEELGFFGLPNVTVIQPEEDYGGNLLDWSPDFKLRDKTYELAKGLL